jgi:hypothetical protein
MTGIGERRVCVMKAGVGGRRRGCNTRGAQVQDAGLYEPQDTKAGSSPPVIALRAPSRRRRAIWATRSRKRRAGRAVAELGGTGMARGI